MKEEKTKHIILRLYSLISPLKGWVILSIVCMAGYNIFTAAPAYYAKDIVDAIVYGAVSYTHLTLPTILLV